MMKLKVLLIIFCVSAATGCTGTKSPGQAKAPSLLPDSGDYTFQRYIEDKEHTEYRVLYSQVPDSKIVQVKTVQELESDDTTEIAETNNFYEELKDGIYGYVVLAEEFPSDWTAKDIKSFPKTKIISFPLEVGTKWTESLEGLGVVTSYHIRSIDEAMETPAKTFYEVIVIDFEEKDADGNSLRKGTSTFAPQFGWIKHETKGEILTDVHELIEINES